MRPPVVLAQWRRDAYIPGKPSLKRPHIQAQAKLRRPSSSLSWSFVLLVEAATLGAPVCRKVPTFPALRFVSQDCCLFACICDLVNSPEVAFPSADAAMNDLFEEFAKAQSVQNGYLVANTLSPVPPAGDPHRLRKVWQSTNSHSAKGDIKHFLKSQTSRRRQLGQEEVNGWVEVYAAYWSALGSIFAAEEGKVSKQPLQGGAGRLPS